jgi:hypothetical protein
VSHLVGICSLPLQSSEYLSSQTDSLANSVTHTVLWQADVPATSVTKLYVQALEHTPDEQTDQARSVASLRQSQLHARA